MEPKIIHLPTSVIAGINRHCGVELHKIFHQPNGEFKHGWFKTKNKKALGTDEKAYKVWLKLFLKNQGYSISNVVNNTTKRIFLNDGKFFRIWNTRMIDGEIVTDWTKYTL